MYQKEPPAADLRFLIQGEISQIIEQFQFIVHGEHPEFPDGSGASVLHPLHIFFHRLHRQICPGILFCDFHTQFLQDAERHKFVVSHNGNDVWPVHHILQHADGGISPINAVSKNIENVVVAEADFFQRSSVFVVTPVNIADYIVHRISPVIRPADAVLSGRCRSAGGTITSRLPLPFFYHTAGGRHKARGKNVIAAVSARRYNRNALPFGWLNGYENSAKSL